MQDHVHSESCNHDQAEALTPEQSEMLQALNSLQAPLTDEQVAEFKAQRKLARRKACNRRKGDLDFVIRLMNKTNQEYVDLLDRIRNGEAVREGFSFAKIVELREGRPQVASDRNRRVNRAEQKAKTKKIRELNRISKDPNYTPRVRVVGEPTPALKMTPSRSSRKARRDRKVVLRNKTRAKLGLDPIAIRKFRSHPATVSK